MIFQDYLSNMHYLFLRNNLKISLEHYCVIRYHFLHNSVLLKVYLRYSYNCFLIYISNLSIFIPISKMEKICTNFGQNGDEFWELIEIGIDMYIYSWSGGKNKTFSKNVCPSVCPCAKVMYTKTQERVEIIECSFFLKGVYLESKLPKFRPERTKVYEARAEWNFERLCYI